MNRKEELKAQILELTREYYKNTRSTTGVHSW